MEDDDDDDDVEVSDVEVLVEVDVDVDVEEVDVSLDDCWGGATTAGGVEVAELPSAVLDWEGEDEDSVGVGLYIQVQKSEKTLFCKQKKHLQ